MLDIILQAIKIGAQVFPNVSGGKDGQAMTKVLHDNHIPMAGLVHADLGRIEWHESLPMCEKLAEQFNLDLYVVKRTDGRGMVEHWANRMHQLQGTGKPFWSSKANRYCTSDLKRDVINKFYRNLPNCDFIISAEGIRASESDDRQVKSPLSINWRMTNDYYRQFFPKLDEYLVEIKDIKKVQLKKKEITIEDAAAKIAAMEIEIAESIIPHYTPGKRLVITWYPIFNFSTEEVWNTYGMTTEKLKEARLIYKQTRIVPTWWPFHPAYAYGNDRVSCVFCIMGCIGDLRVGAEHRPELLDELIAMEEFSGSTFKNKFSLKSLLNETTTA
jgi:3'-phosphoadenosine 5'-phosphosulfate sulfotransferase (PAPS reductase)/FAD synthetase